ncbi:MAG: hypothetical protein HC942_01120 [Microcoleus sp. SU_5_6]|nr:hypothetical protein [Microcoleus sp. SU_5_6]
MIVDSFGGRNRVFATRLREAVQKELTKLTSQVITSLTGWEFILDALSVAGL